MLPFTTRSNSSNNSIYKGDKELKLSNSIRINSNNSNSTSTYSASLFNNLRHNRIKLILILIIFTLLLFLHSKLTLPLESTLLDSITPLSPPPPLKKLNAFSQIDDSSASNNPKVVPIPLNKASNPVNKSAPIVEEKDSLSWPKEWSHLLLPISLDHSVPTPWIGLEALKESRYLENLNTGLLKSSESIPVPPELYVNQAMAFMRMDNADDIPKVGKDGRPLLLKHESLFLERPSVRSGPGGSPVVEVPVDSEVVDKEDLIELNIQNLASGKGRQPLPKIQLDSSKFDKTPSRMKEELERREWVKRAFVHTWTGYKTYAWGHDELLPISHRFSDKFNGWGATIIDTLDTLIIMDLPDQYNLAREHISKLDFTYLLPTSPNAFKTILPKLEIWNPITRKSMHLVHTFTSPTTIPTFETIIRYLGGLISAYDLTHDKLMLKRAVELGDWILPSMDTRYGLAKSRYQFGEDLKGGYAGMTSLAEIGTLSLEFTRLSMLTGDDIYYKAVKRTTSTLSHLPPPDPPSTPSELSDIAELKAESLARRLARQAGLPPIPLDLLPLIEDEPLPEDSPEVAIGKSRRRELARVERERKRVLHESANGGGAIGMGRGGVGGGGGGKKRRSGRLGWLFPTQLDPGSSNLVGVYSFGGEADSFYEYLIKEYQLIGNADPIYGQMYTEAIDSAYEYLIKKIDVVPKHEDLSIVGVQRYNRFQPQLEHLTCFTGGMLGMGSRLLSGISVNQPQSSTTAIKGEREKDMETAIRITNACVWAYESSKAGLGPESLEFLPEGYKEVGGEGKEGVDPSSTLTGDIIWQDKGWKMFTAWVEHSITDAGFASINNVYADTIRQDDSMESFVLAETFKYYYLLFSSPDLISLDDFVFNTEAHPFRIPKHEGSSTPSPGDKITWKDPGTVWDKSSERQGTDVQKCGRIQQAAILARVAFK